VFELRGRRRPASRRPADAIRQRLEAYERDTEPLLAFYQERGLLVEVNGDQSPDEVTIAIKASIAAKGLA